MKKFHFALFFVWCLFTAFPAVAAQPVKGTVFNGANDRGIGELTVELRRNGTAGKPGKLISTTTSNADGTFSFVVPESENDSLLVVQALYKGYPYEVPAFDGGKRLGQFDVEIDPTKVRLPVFDTTSSLIPLEVSASHLYVEPRPGGITCKEYLVVNNATKKTFLGIGEDHATVLLDVPKGAKNVRLDPQMLDAKLNQRPNGFSVSKVIPPTLEGPGTPIVINYEMDWPSRLPWQRSIDLTTEVQYPMRFFFVQRRGSDRLLHVKGFVKTDKEETPLSGDQSIKMNIEGEEQENVINAVGNPKATESTIMPGNEMHITVSAPINPAFWAFFAFLVLLIVLIPFALLRRNAAPSPIEDKAVKMGEPVPLQSVYDEASPQPASAADWLKTPAALQLVEQIAALDEDHEAGRIADEEYQQQRSDLKRTLRDMAPDAKQ